MSTNSLVRTGICQICQIIQKLFVFQKKLYIYFFVDVYTAD